MKRLSVLTVIFAVAFTVFFIGPPLLGTTFSLYPLMRVGDVLDILTPLVLLPLSALAPFLVTCPVALVFVVGWGVYWGGLPEFSEVGIID